MFKSEIITAGLHDYASKHTLPDGARLHIIQSVSVASGESEMRFAYGLGAGIKDWFDSEQAARMAYEISKEPAQSRSKLTGRKPNMTIYDDIY